MTQSNRAGGWRSRADVFISYSSKDVAHAEALEALLEKAGLTVWRDKKRLVPGGNYVFSIHDGIEQAKRVAVLWSRNSIASDYVTAEAEYARGKKKLVPVDIEACEPKVPFNIDHRLPLRHRQHRSPKSCCAR